MLWAHGIVGSSPAIPTPLGGVTEARCPDMAKAVVQLHPERFNKVKVMEQELANKRIHALIRGRGVTAAQQTFNLPGGGSNPPGPIERRACSSTVAAPVFFRPDFGPNPIIGLLFQPLEKRIVRHDVHNRNDPLAFAIRVFENSNSLDELDSASVQVTPHRNEPRFPITFAMACFIEFDIATTSKESQAFRDFDHLVLHPIIRERRIWGWQKRHRRQTQAFH